MRKRLGEPVRSATLRNMHSLGVYYRSSTSCSDAHDRFGAKGTLLLYDEIYAPLAAIQLRNLGRHTELLCAKD